MYAYVAGNPVNHADRSGLYVDTVVDVGFIVKDLFTIGRSVLRGCGIRGEDLAALGGDIASAAIPFATGGGTAAKGILRATDRADDAVDGARRTPGFMVTPGGETYPIPSGARGPLPTQKPGVQFREGSGGRGLDNRVSGIRSMRPTQDQGNRIVYMNGRDQIVDPWTGRTDQSAHYPF